MTIDQAWAVLREELPAAIELRRELHQYPDLSGEEGSTRDRVVAALGTSAGIPSAKTGSVVRIGGPGPAVGVRGELDALPIQESTGIAWASKVPGTMHACGHDVHLAALVALARTLQRIDAPAPLLVVLQPREEAYPSGAKDMVADTWLAEQQCQIMIGAHVQPQLPAHTVTCTPGAVNASNDQFELVVEGTGGHAAYPHVTVDPVLALAQIVSSLQGITSRETDPLATAVLSTTMLSAGSASNAIPDRAVAGGSIRAMDTTVREQTLARVREMAEHIATAHRCRADLRFEHGEPVLYNEPALTETAGALLRELGQETVDEHRSAGSDDFSYFAEHMPSAMFFVGVDTPGANLHSPTFLPPDDAITDVARTLLAGYWAGAQHLEDRATLAHSSASNQARER